MPRTGALGTVFFAAAVHQLAESLRAVHGRGARDRALTIAAAVATQGDDSEADFWAGVVQRLSQGAEGPGSPLLS